MTHKTLNFCIPIAFDDAPQSLNNKNNNLHVVCISEEVYYMPQIGLKHCALLHAPFSECACTLECFSETEIVQLSIDL